MELAWITLVVCSLLTGVAVVAILVARRSLEFPFVVLTVASFAVSLLSLLRIATQHVSSSITLVAIAFLAAAVAGGYALASTLLYNLAPTQDLITLPDSPGPDSGAQAVLLVSCDEPESYRAGSTAEMLLRLADEGVLDVSIAALPLLFFAQKTRYRAIGGVNPAPSQLARIAEGLGRAMRSVHVSAASCSGASDLRAAIGDAIRRGSSSIVVAELSVGQSMALQSIESELEGLGVAAAGIDIRHTGVLWCSDRIVSMVTARIVRAVERAHDTGVVLVGHGQPAQVAEKNPRMDQEESSFLSRLRMNLVEAGLPESNVLIAWADWGDPDVTSAVRHLAASGCRRVIVSPATYPLDTIAVRLDLEISVRQARVRESATVVTLPSWKDDPAVIEELRTRVTEALAGPIA